ncbi:MAG: helix-turn-helix transcriptional regulator [Endomicrobium sp.]|jgi:transcriptional regulator with XRE-family HTH domain|uniref:helix-turn-helix domain-containing protein n=1 Tax=Candidatus Endomicrobiellum cubanum TaxID=3242325 RepID=UPI00281E73EE|nr:helix-turn-helix transcriptional regulator [Endomicrobium sp.]MDR2396148.1 helix-turn-helix transcriptional regulator [Endomicrobium sp.]
MDTILTIKQSLANRVRKRRKEIKLSQFMLAEKSQVSLGSIKRFERSGEISLSSLLRIAVILGYEADFNQLFVRKNYQNLDEIINAK